MSSISRAESALDKVNNRINVTPLADVMLVLLIIFMVVTPLLKPDVSVAVPEASHPRDHPGGESTLVLSMRGDGTFFLNRDPIDESRLYAALSEKIEDRAEKALYIKADESLDYGRVLEIMDVCRRAGADEVALITRQRKN
jgi:biopolymer transport protein ExbD